jgi:flagellar basal-body rod protein FlgG
MQLDTISHNLANVGTNGYKRAHAQFEDLLYQNLRQSGAQETQTNMLPTGLQLGTGVRPVGTSRNFSQGNLNRTENPLDLAIEGPGFFRVSRNNGEIGYTRAGNLSLNDQGQLVTADGYQIQPAIVIPPDAVDVSISKSGQIQIKQAGQPEPSVAGTLELATFVNEGGLEAIGDNLYLESGSSGAPNLSVPGVDGTGVLLQGYTEASNVDAVAEVTALIVAQRAYEMNSKVITSADQMLSTANQVKS